jgi:predicted permease
MRHALRSLLRAPVLFITAVTLLALGIGATTAVFSVVNSVLLAPLPYDNPDRLVRMWTELAARNVAHFPESPVNLEDFRQQATLFETIGGINTGDNATFTGPSGEPQQVSGGAITWDFLSMLGVEPKLGRNFSAEDAAFSATDVPAGAEFPATAFANPRAVLISHRLWQREFGGDRAAVGAIVTLNDFHVEVVGVLPEGFRMYMAPRTNVTPDVDVWTPLRVDFASAPRTNVFLNMVGRVRDGVPIEQAMAQIEQLGVRIYDDNGVMRAAGARKHAMPYGDELVSDVRGSIWALLGAAVFVLLIASANVANLLLVRSAGRTRELAIRTALGARRRQIISPLLAESAVLALFGALGGLALAHAGIVLIVDSAPANVPRLDAVQIEWRVLLFTAAVALATTLLGGGGPAI